MPTTFGELGDQLEEALRARDDEQWCRLFDFYRRGTEPMEKDPHLATLRRRHEDVARGDIERG